jgi:hypothetical protein
MATIYQLPKDPKSIGFEIFPRKIEDCEHTFFHGTSDANAQAIMKNGFLLGAKSGSVSFSERSPLALRYACDARTPTTPDGGVLVVYYPSLKGLDAKRMGGLLDDRTTTSQSQRRIVGYCLIPACYKYIGS